MSYNEIEIQGNVGGEPQLRQLQSGNHVCDINVATNESRLVNGEWQTTHTEWYRVSLWDDKAVQLSQWARKGMAVWVKGRHKTKPYIAESGEARSGNEISAFWGRRFGHGGDSQSDGVAPEAAPQTSSYAAAPAAAADEVDF